jgi:hypothetical protein
MDQMVKKGKITFSDLLKKEPEPARYEINIRDRKFIFELKNREKVEPAHDKRDSTTWVIRVMPRKDGFHFQCRCENLHLYFLTIENPKK